MRADICFDNPWKNSRAFRSFQITRIIAVQWTSLADPLVLSQDVITAVAGGDLIARARVFLAHVQSIKRRLDVSSNVLLHSTHSSVAGRPFLTMSCAVCSQSCMRCQMKVFILGGTFVL